MAGAEEISFATPEARGGRSAVRGRGFSLLQVVRHRLRPKWHERKLRNRMQALASSQHLFSKHTSL